MINKKYRQMVKTLDNKLDQSDEAFSIAAILLGAANVGTNIRNIVAETGVPYKTVQKTVWHLRSGGVFKGKKIHHSGWFDEDGGIAFWLDVAIGQGFLRRTPTAEGDDNKKITGV